jgi:hypothetical protein
MSAARRARKTIPAETAPLLQGAQDGGNLFALESRWKRARSAYLLVTRSLCCPQVLSRYRLTSLFWLDRGRGTGRVIRRYGRTAPASGANNPRGPPPYVG